MIARVIGVCSKESWRSTGGSNPFWGNTIIFISMFFCDTSFTLTLLRGHSQTTLTRFYPLLTTKYPLLILGMVLLYCYWIPFKIPIYLLCLLNVICECPSPQPFRLWRKKSKVKYRYGSKMAGIFSADSKCIKLVEHSLPWSFGSFACHLSSNDAPVYSSVHNAHWSFITSMGYDKSNF